MMRTRGATNLIGRLRGRWYVIDTLRKDVATLLMNIDGLSDVQGGVYARV